MLPRNGMPKPIAIRLISNTVADRCNLVLGWLSLLSIQRLIAQGSISEVRENALKTTVLLFSLHPLALIL